MSIKKRIHTTILFKHILIKFTHNFEYQNFKNHPWFEILQIWIIKTCKWSPPDLSKNQNSPWYLNHLHNIWATPLKDLGIQTILTHKKLLEKLYNLWTCPNTSSLGSLWSWPMPPRSPSNPCVPKSYTNLAYFKY